MRDCTCATGIDVDTWTTCARWLSCCGERWTMTTNAMPLSGGMWLKNVLSRSDASRRGPQPDYGKLAAGGATLLHVGIMKGDGAGMR